MFPPYSFPDFQPTTLRRRHPPRSRNIYSDQRSSEVEYAAGNLDLSVHWPRAPFNNRYGLLTPPQPARTVIGDRKPYHTRPSRRGPNSRGSKEGKKRRDARRNERRWAAHLLNEQLSLQIDQTLKRANFQPPSMQYLPAPVSSWQASVPYTAQPSNGLVRQMPSPAPSPPQLPVFNFGRFEICDFPNPTPQKATLTSPPRNMSRDIPSWCPPISCLQSPGANQGILPTFFDLSSLPEPKETARPARPCQELQLWRGNNLLSKPKQSRFFPTRAPSTCIVNLPRTSCRLHKSDNGCEDMATHLSSTPIQHLPPASHTHDNEQLSSMTTAQPEPQDPSTAANLWRVLASTQLDESVREEKLCNRQFQPLRGDEEYSPASAHVQPAELDSKEIPYVHANSLVGHADQITNDRDNDVTLSESLALLANIFVLAAENIISNHNKPCSEPNETLARADERTTPSTSAMLPAELSDSCITPSDDHLFTFATDADNHDEANAQYASEQDLFKAPNPPAAVEESDCDLATFLTMGHVENCWCRDCDEAPTLVEEDTLTEDDGWLVWSTVEVDDENSSTQAAESEACEEEEVEKPSLPPPTAPAWDDMFPRLPQRPVWKAEGTKAEDWKADDWNADSWKVDETEWETTEELNELNDEYDWCWNF